MLGVERSASEKEVKTAFRRLAMNIHPDVSALPRQEAERRVKNSSKPMISSKSIMAGVNNSQWKLKVKEMSCELKTLRFLLRTDNCIPITFFHHSLLFYSLLIRKDCCSHETVFYAAW